jgi:protein-disulfide isomerase
LREQEVNQRKQQVMNALPKVSAQLFADNVPGRAVAGNAKGTAILVEFLSYQCGHCKSTAEVVTDMIKNHPELKVIYIEWPIFGNDAVYASKAALAANKQNKFEVVHHALLNTTESLHKTTIDRIVKKLGINMKKLEKDMNDKALDNGLKENFKLAQTLGLMGTPSFIFANDKLTKFSLVPGQTPDFAADMEHALKEVQ